MNAGVEHSCAAGFRISIGSETLIPTINKNKLFPPLLQFESRWQEPGEQLFPRVRVRLTFVVMSTGHNRRTLHRATHRRETSTKQLTSHTPAGTTAYQAATIGVQNPLAHSSFSPSPKSLPTIAKFAMMEDLDLLILGAGWTATFLIPLLQQRNISFEATTTSGRPVAGRPTIPFKFDPTDPDHTAIAALPRARTLLITFPLYGPGPSAALHAAYTTTHQSGAPTTTPSRTPFRFIQLGSTGIWQRKGGQTLPLSNPNPDGSPWLTRHSPFDTANPRAIAEDELLRLGGCVLNLSGLWGGARDPRAWVGRVAKTKDEVRAKKSLHLIHGVDVARAVAAMVGCNGATWEEHGEGQRWMLTDGFVYDWWALLAGWAEVRQEGEEGVEGGEVVPSQQARWVGELMAEGEGVRGLPRQMEVLGRCYDSREFWRVFGLVPLKARV